MKTYTDEQIERVREGIVAFITMSSRGPKPNKIDDALTWRENDEKASAMINAALAILDQPQESKDADSEVYLTSHYGYACVRCDKLMSFDVPRVGSSGGFVHAATGKFECADTGIAAGKEKGNGT